ncbi:MAG: RDD family protein [Pseudonocardiaceae bacterium]
MREPARLPEPAALTQVRQTDTGDQTGGELPAVGVAEPLAGFGARVISCLIDYVAPAIGLSLLLYLGVVLGSPTWSPVLAAVGYLGLLGFGIWNSGYLQGTTGRSLGRRVAHTKLVAIETGQPVGFGSAMARQICHGVEFGIGYLWPLWDGKRQTFADKIGNTVVIRVDPRTEADTTTEDRTGSTTP